MNIKKDDKSELEIEIDKKIVQSRNEVKTKKQLLEEAENKKKQLEKDAKENNKKEVVLLRSPHDILEEMKALDEESAEILNSILELI